jgi:hypothetical protein
MDAIFGPAAVWRPAAALAGGERVRKKSQVIILRVLWYNLSKYDNKNPHHTV